MKLRPVGVELFHADGQTDMTKLTVAFRSFANAPNKAGGSLITTSCIICTPRQILLGRWHHELGGVIGTYERKNA
jgi:hypothetical protein